MSEARLPAHLEAGGLIRVAEAGGGFGMVLHKGDRDAGTLLLVMLERGGGPTALPRLWERMPQLDGTRKWTEIRLQGIDSEIEINKYLTRRQRQDPDVWIVELTVADPTRFVSEMSSAG